MSEYSLVNRVTYEDTVLSDGAVNRVYSNGTSERRVVQAPGVIVWTDNRNRQGRDIFLGDGRIRREEANGTISEGQQVGNGLTVWNNGQFRTVNLTRLPQIPLPPPQMPKGFGKFLVGIGVGGLFGLRANGIGPYGTDPATAEYVLYAEALAYQQMLAQQRQMQQGGGGDDGGVFIYYGGYYYGDPGGGGTLGDSGAGGNDWGGNDSFG